MTTIIGPLSSASILFPVLFGVFANQQTRVYRALFLFFLFGLIVETIAYGLAKNNLSNNLWVYNIYNLVETVFWIVVIAKWLNGKFFYLVYPLVVAFIVAWIYSTLIKQSIFDFNNLFSVAESLVLIPLAALYLLELSRNATLPLTKVPEFWFASGVLFFFSSTSIIHATANYIFDTKEIMGLIWSIHSLFNIITNLIFAKAFLCIPRKTT